MSADAASPWGAESRAASAEGRAGCPPGSSGSRDPEPDRRGSRTARPPSRPRGERELCAGRHLGTPLKDAWPLEWVPVVGAPERARVLEHTCDRCRPISYELLLLGGAFLIRRTERKPSRTVVHETARVRKTLALEWWQALLAGAAA